MQFRVTGTRSWAESRDLRSGQGDQADSEEERKAGASGVAPGTEVEESREPTLKDSAGILKAFMEQQQVQENHFSQLITQWVSVILLGNVTVLYSII